MSIPYEVVPGAMPNAFAYAEALIPGLPFPNPKSLFNPKIRVTEGAIDLFTPEELEAVLTHEMGHVAHKHLPIKQIAPMVLSRRVANPLMDKGLPVNNWFGRQALHYPGKIITNNAVSYALEHDADTYALRRGHGPGLASALSKMQNIQREMIGSSTPLKVATHAQEWLSGSLHPGLSGRVRRASRWAEKAKAGDSTVARMVTRRI